MTDAGKNLNLKQTVFVSPASTIDRADRLIDKSHRRGYGNAMDPDNLVRRAWAAREHAYAPYSKFKVGAALWDETGEVFVGCNVENLSYGLTICAERAAVSAAVAAGARKFRTIAIVSDSHEPVSPCGACRQVLAEFSLEIRVICENLGGQRFEASLAELLPRAKTGILDKEVERPCST
jgi:cytidine deaminase